MLFRSREAVTRVKEEAEARMQVIIKQAKDDYEMIVAEVESLQTKDQTLINDQKAKTGTEMESIIRTSHWSQTLMKSAHAASLLNELQSGPSRRLVQQLPPELTQLPEQSLVAPRIKFQQNQELSFFGNIIGKVTHNAHIKQVASQQKRNPHQYYH